MPLGMEIGLSPRDFLLDGDPAPLPKKEAEPGAMRANFRPTSIVAIRSLKITTLNETIFVWIKMPLGTEVGLGLRDIVFDVDQLPSEKKAHPHPPNFWPMSIVAKWLNG